MNVREIVRAYLVDNDYDGLWIVGCARGCFLRDLMPCNNISAEHCHAGYESPHSDGEWIGPEKENENNK